jgi:hypothetical protein
MGGRATSVIVNWKPSALMSGRQVAPSYRYSLGNATGVAVWFRFPASVKTPWLDKFEKLIKIPM